MAWSQLAVVGRWFDGLPVAVLPLWQVLQVPGGHARVVERRRRPRRGAMALIAAGVVGRWFDGLPVAVLPLWQVLQVPAATPEWLNVAGVHAVVRWH